ncbi:MAG: Gfo/Idh/MocA family oxidoreductase [Chloroflexota bacterium]|nr:Gfo/Idh/MocA family oxidoreductase [Chloroflexota bacterium]
MGLHVGIIGGGFVGRVHLETMLGHDAVSSVSIADSDAALLAVTAGEFPLRRAEADYRALLDDPLIDIVDVCLPHDLHHPVALEAFAAGKHVIADKPIANTLLEADEMIAAAEAADRRFYVALNQRFLPVHERVRSLLADGFIDHPSLATFVVAGDELARMSLPEHWKGTWDRAGGGALADSGTHIVDLAHDWFGPPTAVRCHLARHVIEAPDKADDTAALILEYPSLTVSMVVGYAAAGQPWSETREMWSETGSIHVRLESPEPLDVWKGGKQIPQTVEHDTDWWPWSVKRGLAHAVDAIADDRPFAVTPQDARATLRTIRAAYESAGSGSRIVMADYEGALE